LLKSHKEKLEEGMRDLKRKNEELEREREEGEKERERMRRCFDQMRNKLAQPQVTQSSNHRIQKFRCKGRHEKVQQ